mmetsp:Transcript_16984/g.35916  ORF Transcript_16984/g.35916 Transcript_16984/m.35916 type:complete len:257 (+) Transcript_16984:401-1171(+)
MRAGRRHGPDLQCAGSTPPDLQHGPRVPRGARPPLLHLGRRRRLPLPRLLPGVRRQPRGAHREEDAQAHRPALQPHQHGHHRAAVHPVQGPRGPHRRRQDHPPRRHDLRAGPEAHRRPAAQDERVPQREDARVLHARRLRLGHHHRLQQEPLRVPHKEPRPPAPDGVVRDGLGGALLGPARSHGGALRGLGQVPLRRARLPRPRGRRRPHLLHVERGAAVPRVRRRRRRAQGGVVHGGGAAAGRQGAPGSGGREGG